jgi:hypothetical protein
VPAGTPVTVRVVAELPVSNTAIFVEAGEEPASITYDVAGSEEVGASQFKMTVLPLAEPVRFPDAPGAASAVTRSDDTPIAGAWQPLADPKMPALPPVKQLQLVIAPGARLTPGAEVTTLTAGAVGAAGVPPPQAADSNSPTPDETMAPTCRRAFRFIMAGTVAAGAHRVKPAGIIVANRMIETLGQYKMLDRLGRGAVGELFRARDTRLGRTVAIRVVADDIAADPEKRSRFLADAAAAAALSHPNIASLYEVGDDDGRLFLASEFAPGETLRTMIAGRPLNPRRAVDIAMQIAEGLAEAHAAGLDHQDLRPENIIVTPKGRAKILELGFTRWKPVAAELQTDVCSLGMLLFEMLTGRPPAAGDHALGQPAALNDGLLPDLDVVVGRMIGPEQLRYESAATAAAELRTIVEMLDARSAETDAVTVRTRHAPRPHYGRWIALAALLAGLAAAWWRAG